MLFFLGCGCVGWMLGATIRHGERLDAAIGAAGMILLIISR